MKLKADWKEKALEHNWEKHDWEDSWIHFIQVEEHELDKIISICKYYKKDEMSNAVADIKNIMYKSESTENTSINRFALKLLNPLLCKEHLIGQFCYRKQAAKKEEIQTHLDQILSFFDKAPQYATMINSFYWQEQKKKQVREALEQQYFRDDEVQSIEEALSKFGSLMEIDGEWQRNRYNELRNERKCATSAK